MSTVTLDNSQIFLEIQDPIFPDRSPEDFQLDFGIFGIISPTISLPYAGLLQDTLSVQLPFKSINRNHPLVRENLKDQYVKSRSEFNIFVNWVIGRLSEDIPGVNNFLRTLPSNQVGYSMFRLGQLYLTIDWSQYQKELRPPYKIWSKDLGFIEVTEEHFKKWAQSNITLP